MSRVFCPLAGEPFAKFTAGLKTWEVRNAEGNPVAAQVRKAGPGAAVLLRLGYGRSPKTGDFIQAEGRIARTWEGPADEMPDAVKAGAALTPDSWSGRYFDPNGRVLCFEVVDLVVGDSGDMMRGNKADCKDDQCFGTCGLNHPFEKKDQGGKASE